MKNETSMINLIREQGLNDTRKNA